MAILRATTDAQITENVETLELYPKLMDEVMKEIEEILPNAPKLPVTRIPEVQ